MSVSITMRHRKLHLYVQLLYTKISYLRKNTYLQKDATFLGFHFVFYIYVFVMFIFSFMFPSEHICVSDHSSLIQQNHINESKVHLNRYGTVVFANTLSRFISEYYRWDHDNSNKIHLVQDNYNKELKCYLQVSDKENQANVSNSIETLNQVTFQCEKSILLDQSTLSTLNYKSISDSFQKLENIDLT